jgi:hypothetical protein
MKLTLLLLVGGGGQSSVEVEINLARLAAAQDLLESCLESGAVEHAIVATDDPTWAKILRDPHITIDLDASSESFHFGERLAGLIARYQVQKALYAGGGAAPLVTPENWNDALRPLLSGQCNVVTNNIHSADWVAFHPAQEALPLIRAQARDNSLAWTLGNEGGLDWHSLPPTAASRFDLDTPADLLVARAHSDIGVHLRARLDKLDWPTETVEGILSVMVEYGSNLAVIGRSSAASWAALEKGTQCWVRMFAEERGMIASGRLDRDEVGSLLAEFVARVGVDGFIGSLATLSDAALFDTRVVLAAQGIWPDNSSRFNADLFHWHKVEDPFLRDLSKAASQASIPILLGGQSVVSGGLMALVQIAEERRSSQ